MKRRRCTDRLNHHAHQWQNQGQAIGSAGRSGPSTFYSISRTRAATFWCPGIKEETK